jgi:AhpD family alkylhydroperoxidase
VLPRASGGVPRGLTPSAGAGIFASTPDRSRIVTDRLTEFRQFRERLNRRILESGNLEIKRFFALDTRAYEPGALPTRTKELLGLVASMVLRCDDCVTYHLIRCLEEGVTEEELFDTFNVALVVGGSIVIPHLRRAVDALDVLVAQEPGGQGGEG